jgi:hypothetical protein
MPSSTTTTLIPSSATSIGHGSVRLVHTQIPESRHPNGPVTRRRLRRTFLGLACVWAIGAIPLLVGASAEWKAFGLGLILPGGGFVYTSDPVFAALSLVAFVLSLFVLWAIAPVLLPPIVVLGTAWLSTLRTDTGLWDWAQAGVPAALAALLAVGVAGQQIMFRRRRRRGRALNERLRNVTFPVSRAPSSPPVAESSPEDLAALRYALDLGLQPLDSWDGFIIMDQFREAALRYQLSFLQYAAAMSQYTRTPAFTGYLAEAQRNAIEKMLDPRVWSYWRWENLWGNLRWDPDPVKHDNVMYSGYWGLMLSLHESVNGDRRYAEPGALTLRKGEREVHRYDSRSLAKAVRDNLLGSPFCLFACEPTWVYSTCSAIGLNAAIADSRLNGDDADDVIARFREGFEREFVRADGRLMAARNGRFGFPMPGVATASDAALVPWLNPGLPDVAQRIWWTMREAIIDVDAAEPLRALGVFDRVDAGNYRLGASTYARMPVLFAAREMGDAAAADAIQRSVDATTQIEEEGGVRRYGGLSVWGNLYHTLARFARRDAMRDMITSDIPEAWATGPRLAGAAYPDVLVARAVTDGRALDLVLRPGAGPVRTTLALERLTPGATYTVEGGASRQIVADARGNAAITDVDLGDRLELRVRPS